MKQPIELQVHQYSNTCNDGCCYNYGTIVSINGEELPCHNEDVETQLIQVLEHLGYEVTFKRLYNGEEI